MSLDEPHQSRLSEAGCLRSFPLARTRMLAKSRVGTRVFMSLILKGMHFWFGGGVLVVFLGEFVGVFCLS